MKLIVLIVVVVVLVAFVQLMKMYELASKLKNKKEEDIPDGDNLFNARMWIVYMVLYFGSVIYLIGKYGISYTREAASEHGVGIDALMMFNWWIIGIVFFIVHIFLFYFAYKYVYNKDRRAYYYVHNNKLEMVWTIIPAVVLFVIIFYGLRTWNTIMESPSEDALKIELYGKQFDWTARYPGDDGRFGLTNFNLISNQNPLGIVTKKTYKFKLEEIKEELANFRNQLTANKELYSKRKIKRLEAKIKHLVLHKNRILQINLSDERLVWGKDDRTSKVEFHLPIDRQAAFQFRSRDVIHSAFMFDFRAQMNINPGMTTTFNFKPIISTKEMREKIEDDSFDYKLACNKICGASHWNMTMTIVIEDEIDFMRWLSELKVFEDDNQNNKQAMNTDDQVDVTLTKS